MISEELRIVFHTLAIISSLYIVMIAMSVLLSWFGNVHDGLYKFFNSVSKPWLKLFSKIKSLRYKHIDLTPILAIIVLSLISNIFWQLADARQITLMFILNQLVNLVFSAFNFVLLVFGVLTLIRLVGLLMNASTIGRIWMSLDHILQPFVYRFISRLFPHRNIPYGTALGFFFGTLLILWMALIGLRELFLALIRGIGI